MNDGGLPARNSGVSTGPGAIAFTVMPLSPRSFARTRTICSTEPFVAAKRRPMGRMLETFYDAHDPEGNLNNTYLLALSPLLLSP